MNGLRWIDGTLPKDLDSSCCIQVIGERHDAMELPLRTIVQNIWVQIWSSFHWSLKYSATSRTAAFVVHLSYTSLDLS